MSLVIMNQDSLLNVSSNKTGMKLQAFLFSVLALSLYYHCNNNSQQESQANNAQAETEQATQQSQTDPSIAQSQVPLGDSPQNSNSGKRSNPARSNKNPFGVLVAKT